VRKVLGVCDSDAENSLESSRLRAASLCSRFRQYATSLSWIPTAASAPGSGSPTIGGQDTYLLTPI
jgi:hypothetical protein